MKVEDVWSNETVPLGHRTQTKEKRTSALSHELKLLLNRQQKLYQQLKDIGAVFPPEDSHILLGNKDDWINIQTIRQIGMLYNFFIPYTDENKKIEEIFNRLNQRADKIKKLLTQVALDRK